MRRTATGRTADVLRVLLVEDSDDDAQLILAELQVAGFAVDSERVEDAEALRHALDAREWDVVLTDHSLPGFDSAHAIQIVRERGVDAPCIIVSGRIGEQAVAGGLRAGAADYVDKDSIEELGPTVRGILAKLEARRRRQAEIDARRLAEQRTERVIERVAEAVAIVGSDGTLLESNATARRLFEGLGDPGADRSKRPFIGAVRADGSPLPVDEMPSEVTRLTGRELTDEVLGFPTTGGETRWLRLSTRRLWDGSPPHTVVVSAGDVTGQLEIAERLRASEERFRMTVDHAPIGIALISPEGHWLRVNKAICDMTGYAEGELLSKTFQDITHPDDLETDLEYVRQMLAGEIATYEMEKRYFRADGSIMWILLSVSLVRDAGGEPVHFVSQIQDITERKRYERELRDMADHDALTGLANRRALGAEVERQLAHQSRYGGELALLMIDLDHFKYINDSLGHRVGDQVIRAVAGALRERLRETDTIARLGGDEFAVVLPQTDLRAAELVAGELGATIEQLRVGTVEREVQVTASIGVVEVAAGQQSDEDALLAAGDLAMYEAKDAGRNRFAVYDAEGDGQLRADARLNWSHRIRRALEDDLFVMHYQPIVDLADRSDFGYEALIRMADEPGEPIPPASFLDVAERYGLMPAIDRWVIRKVITTVASGQLPPGTTVALNISARSITDAGLLDLAERLLTEYEVAPEQLLFEVTETAAISRLEDARRFGRRLQRLGCGFALDDFGTGFGSFFHLKHLPYGYIKIDGDFVRGMTQSRHDRLLVDALVRVAAGMGKKTVAEFVGDEETVTLLSELGVDYAQGYHLGRPTPPGDLRDRFSVDGHVA